MNGIADEKRFLRNIFERSHEMVCAIKSDSYLIRKDFFEFIHQIDEFREAIYANADEELKLNVYMRYQDAVISTLDLLYKYYTWGFYGFNVFNVNRGLCQLLALTDSSSAPIVPMPYPSFFIMLHPGSCVVNGKELRGIWIQDIQRSGTILVEPYVIGATGFLLSFFAQWNKLSTLEIDSEKLKNSDSDINTFFKFAARLAANLCFYLASPRGRDEMKHPPTEKGEKRVPGITWPRCWGLGKGLAIDKRLEQAMHQGGGLTRLKFKHIVRGHWRNQACGVGMSERRVMWIQPYWKGPDVDAAWSHAYNLR